MSENKLPDWIYVPELEDSIVEAETLDDFLTNNTILLNILNNINEGISIITPDYKVAYLNNPMKNWYQGSDRIGMQCYCLFQNRSKLCENCPVEKAMKTGKPCGEQVPYAGSGEFHGEMHVYATPIHNSSGEVCLILEYVQNISFQKLMLHSFDDVQNRVTVLEAQNKLLLKNLAVRERQLQEMEDTIQENMNLHIRPVLDYLKKHINEKDFQLVSSILELAFYRLSNMEESKLPNLASLTSREMQVANLLKDGYSSKEIANKLFITKKAVDFHRRNIRRKLGVDPKVNLQVYLQMSL